LLFTEYVTDRSWKALVKPAKRVKNEMGLIAEGGKLSAGFTIKERLPDATWLVSLESPEGVTIEDVLWQLGRVPLPHYIKRAPTQSDSKTYQTIFAKNPGAIASPTASLHFTEDLIRRLEASGVAISFVTLHVGIGTFKPVKESDPNNHMMHEERYALSEETTANLARTKKAGGRIIAVGTTVVRVLEHCSQTGCLAASSGATRLMIMPGYSFKAVDGMITNFHVPQSTLLMLVCAFAGKDFILTAYREAIEREYRFFSYGDAMIIL
jgi:S-adenosylmethionine:tRNA ribosyltransferase-isomerase